MQLSAMDILWPAHLPLLATALEELGYHRLWFTEHHGTRFQSARPALMCGILGARTTRLRVGTAAVLLSFYSPMEVVEDFRVLETFFPGRVDLGVASGRLSEPFQTYLLDGREHEYDRKLSELITLWRGGSVAGVTSASLGPQVSTLSPLWVCGGSLKSARRAGELGVCFAYHHTIGRGKDASALIREYTNAFVPNVFLEAPRFNVACYGACAGSDDAALAMFLSCRRKVREESSTASVHDSSDLMPDGYVVGSEATCADALRGIAKLYGTNEIVFQSFGPDVESRIDSYARIARALRD